MEKWEYKLLDSSDAPGSGLLKGRSREAIEKHLSDLGEQGWEIVNMDFRELEGRTSFTGVAKRKK